MVHPLAERIEEAVWRRADTLDALHRRDIGALYRILHRHGVSYRKLAVIAGHGEPEVHAIVHGRQVRSYDVLARIAANFGIPPGWMGLGSAGGCPAGNDPSSEDPDDDMRRREMLSLAAAAATGGVLPPFARLADDRPWQPKSIGMPDVEHLERLRAELWSLNERYGSAGQHQAMLALWQRATGMLDADMSDSTRRGLLTLCSRVGSAVGWSAADCGDNAAARTHFHRALGYAGHARDPMQAARALAFAGRSELQWGSPAYALRMFQLGDVAADRARSRLLRATINIHGAQAAALAGWPDTARTMASRGVDEYGAAGAGDPAKRYPWGDIASARAAVRFALGDPEGAIADITEAARDVPGERVRSRAFRHARLARCHLAAGNHDEGVRAGRQAVDAAGEVRSARVLGRLAPVADVADTYSSVEAGQLAHAVRRLCATR